MRMTSLEPENTRPTRLLGRTRGPGCDWVVLVSSADVIGRPWRSGTTELRFDPRQSFADLLELTMLRRAGLRIEAPAAGLDERRRHRGRDDGEKADAREHYDGCDKSSSRLPGR